MKSTDERLHRLTIVAHAVLNEINQNAHLLDVTSRRMTSACATCGSVSQNLRRVAAALDAELHRADS